MNKWCRHNLAIYYLCIWPMERLRALTPPSSGTLLSRGLQAARTRPRRLMSATPTRKPSQRDTSAPMPSGTGRFGSGLICVRNPNP